MKFRYKKYSPTILRPVIPIELKYKDGSLLYEVLVDSGADINIFDAEIGEALGIDLITGDSRQYYLHYVDLTVGGVKFKNVKVGFLKDMGKYAYGIVGQI